ncbi:MAG: tetratricopeptide repeat protein [Gammaproteobacteria bacterium]|nr:tetratricopeptide repeat protein [Gammaproteobacteria bacterium]
MQENRRWRSVFVLTTLVALTHFPLLNTALAGDEESSSASAHILQAEMALQRKEYLKATIEYRKAAEQSNSAELARKATQLGYAYKFNDEALLAAKRWVKLDKNNEDARQVLGLIYFRLDDIRNARRQFERYIKSSEEDLGQDLAAVSQLLQREELAERADKLMRALTKPHKKSADAHYEAAVLALQAGDGTYARERAGQAIEIEPDNVKPRLLYARALMYEGDEEGAIEYLAHIIGDSPQPDPDARMELALMYMITGRDDDALSQVNQVLLEQAGRVDALRLMAIINFRLERLDAAWQDFQDLLATGQYRMDALYYLARIADYREQYERAVRLYREVTWGSNAVFSQRRASALMAHQLDDVKGAFEHLEEFATTVPNYAVDMVVAKAQLLVSLERYDEGLAEYEKAIEFRPDDEGMALGRAELLLRIDRVDDAVREYRKAAKRWPDSALTLNALGYTLADRTEQYEEAEKLIRRAIEKEPENPAIIDSLGWVLYKLGNLEDGLVELQRAFERMKDHEVASHIVEVLAELERHEEALEVLEAAEQRNPDSELLKDVRSRYFDDAE